MAAPSFLTWDFILGAGFRAAKAASIEDLGGAQLQDDAEDPPIPPEMPYADQLNQWAKQLGALNRVCLALDLEVRFISGTPTIVNVAAMSTQITLSTVTAGLGTTWTVTHNSTGVVTVAWSAGVLPPPRAKPRAWVLDPSSPYPQPGVVPSPNQVQVKTWALNGTPTDLPFVVSIF